VGVGVGVGVKGWGSTVLGVQRLGFNSFGGSTVLGVKGRHCAIGGARGSCITVVWKGWVKGV